MPLTPLADLPLAEDFPLVPLPAALKGCAKWRKALLRIHAPGGGERRAHAWASESRCPGLLVQLCGDRKAKALGLLHVPTGWLVGGPALRWPATPEGRERALAASAAAVDLLPPTAWTTEDPAAQAEGGRPAFVARGREWARRVGSPSTWRVTDHAPLEGWPDEIRRAAEDAAREGATVEVLGYADEQDRKASVCMVHYRLDWLDRQVIVTDRLDASAREREAERLARYFAEGGRLEVARRVLENAPLPPAAVDALERLGRLQGGAPTLRGLLWAARQVLAAGGVSTTARALYHAWDDARRSEDLADRAARLRLFVALLAAVRRSPDDGIGNGGAELFPGADRSHVGVADVSPAGSARWRLFRRALPWLKGSPLLPVCGVWDTCGEVAGPRLSWGAMDAARERAQWAADHPSEAAERARQEGRL